MKQLILHGSSGRMGRMVREVLTDYPAVHLAACIDQTRANAGETPVFGDIHECNVPGDVILDFSAPGAIKGLTAYAVSNRIPLVIATTGLGEEELEAVRGAAQAIPVFMAPNFSLGVNLLVLCLEELRNKLPEGFELDIFEKHHNQKKDAPSGTALMLGEVSGCSPERILALRAGNLPGEHTVQFTCGDETLELTHRAYSRSIFARGAVEAAAWLPGHAPGMYGMRDLLSGQMGLS